MQNTSFELFLVDFEIEPLMEVFIGLRKVSSKGRTNGSFEFVGFWGRLLSLEKKGLKIIF